MTPPGQVSEADYGRRGRWFDPLVQRLRVANGCLMAVVFSRHVIVDPVFICDSAGGWRTSSAVGATL